MKLNQYPQAIAELQRRILDFDQNLIALSESVKIFEAEIDNRSYALTKMARYEVKLH